MSADKHLLLPCHLYPSHLHPLPLSVSPFSLSIKKGSMLSARSPYKTPLLLLHGGRLPSLCPDPLRLLPGPAYLCMLSHVHMLCPTPGRDGLYSGDGWEGAGETRAIGSISRWSWVARQGWESGHWGIECNFLLVHLGLGAYSRHLGHCHSSRTQWS